MESVMEVSDTDDVRKCPIGVIGRARESAAEFGPGAVVVVERLARGAEAPSVSYRQEQTRMPNPPTRASQDQNRMIDLSIEARK